MVACRHAPLFRLLLVGGTAVGEVCPTDPSPLLWLHVSLQSYPDVFGALVPALSSLQQPLPDVPASFHGARRLVTEGVMSWL